MSDYKINVFEVAFLPDETIKKLRGDFRIVADYLSQVRKTGQYIVDSHDLQHPFDTMALLHAITNDDSFELAYTQGKEDEVNTIEKFMHNFGMSRKAEGMAEGEAEGLVEGEAKAKRNISLELAKMGLATQKIAQAVSASIEEVEDWIKEARFEKEIQSLQ